jgi:hypothetical protein
MQEIKPIVGPDGSVDYGNIEGFHKVGHGTYEFSGEFGDVRIKGGGVRLEINQLPKTAT